MEPQTSQPASMPTPPPASQETIDRVIAAVNQVAGKMETDTQLRINFRAHPLQVLADQGAPISDLPERDREVLGETLSGIDTFVNVKCFACKAGLGTALGVLGGPLTLLVLIPSLESSEAMKILQVIATFTGLSYNAVVQVVQAVLAVGGTPAELFKNLLNKICTAAKACG